MNWQKLLAYLGGAIALIVLGWLLHSAFIPKPSTTVKETIRYDTLYQTKTVTFTKTKTDTVFKITDRKFIYSDSIVGDTNQVKYKIKHTIQSDKKILNFWEVDLVPRMQTIIKFVTKDSVRTITEAKYISMPFFMNTYFWSTVVLVVITALSIVF